MPGTTPSQTVGPYFSIGLPWPEGPHVVEPGTEGAIVVRGHIIDGEGAPVPDALVETWQAAPDGGFGAGFRGFGRCPTDEDGAWEITTLKPGPVAEGHAPHIAVSVFARGLLDRVVTRIYFADEEANAADPVLAGLSEAQRATLLARLDDGAYRFDVHLQGADETTFFQF